MIARAPSGTEPAPLVGGFFEQHDLGPAVGVGVLAAWTAGRPYAAFVSARAALAALVAAYPHATLWAPAFLCPEALQAVASDRVRFYPMEAAFEPDLTAVEAEAKAGDLVLLVAYFGLPVARAARDLAARRRDLLIIEDRAQALGSDLPSCGGYLLYSPRKLLGVADGGILVAPGEGMPLPQPVSAADAEALWLAPRLRYADPAGADNARWYAANRAKEAAMPAAPQAITPRSLSILSHTAIGPLAEARLANWRALDERLHPWSALPRDVDHAPLGYVLRLEPGARDRLLGALHAARVFAAVHWPVIAAVEQDFPREAQWTRELVTLPCDHRYGAADMMRIADLVLEHLA